MALLAASLLQACALTPESPLQIKENLLNTLGLTHRDKGFISAALSPAAQPDSSNALPTMTHWWTRLNAPILTTQINALLSDNLDIAQASQRILQAQAQLDSAHGKLMPNIGASADASRNRSFFDLGALSDTVYSSRYEAGLSAAWELDLFRRLRNSKQSARSRFNATLYDREALAHSLITTVVDLRVMITAQSRRLKLSKRIAKNRAHAHTLAKRRYESGSAFIRAQDLYTAKILHQAARAAVRDDEIALTRSLHALDSILGKPPGTHTTNLPPFPLDAAPPPVPVCLPAALLDRRPDLKAQSLRTAAAHSDVKIAMADLYPTLSIGGTVGFSSNSLGTLLSSESLVGSVIASLKARLFEGGSLRAAIRLKDAQAQEAMHGYAEALLQALEDVENALSADQHLTAKTRATKAAMKADESRAASIDSRYHRGLATLQDVLEAETMALATAQTHLNTQQQLWQARTALYLSLGGDWFGLNTTLSSTTHPACARTHDQQRAIQHTTKHKAQQSLSAHPTPLLDTIARDKL